jgi:hypothetical protein
MAVMASEEVMQPGQEMALRLELGQSLYGLIDTQTLYVAAKLGLADLLADGPRSAAQLATETGTDAHALRRLLRFLASKGLFAEDGQGQFALTPKGRVFRSMRAAALYWGDSWNWTAWPALLDSVRSGKTSFDLAHGQPLFAHMAQHPADAKVFNDYMASMSSGRSFARVPDVYDVGWAQCIVDVGGGLGDLLVAMLAGQPQARGVLYDLPQVIAAAATSVAKAEVGQRCELLAGDFFESVPNGGDLYLLSNILHDWDDERALLILRNCRGVMPSESRLLILEAVVPEGNDPALAKLVDMVMLALTGGQQRTEAEFRTLLAASGFGIAQVLPLDPINSLIEATPA